jgi:hypothetical protein
VGARSFVRFGRSKGRALTTTAPPRSRTTVELIGRMIGFARVTETEALRILHQLERGGWIEHEDDKWWATRRARHHFGAIASDVGEETPGGRPSYGYGRRVA